MSRAATLRKTLVATGVISYVGLAALATLYASAALYPLMHKQLPQQVAAHTVFGYWDAYSVQPKERKKLLFAIGAPAAVLFIVAPVGLAAAGQRRRELHGSATPAYMPTKASCSASSRIDFWFSPASNRCCWPRRPARGKASRS
jgi:hypothetical protein